ncbi:MAG: chalcone isomerase family protein [Gammaproteobacteria bacterium]|nr:chalcone isomerase family protein [Gammaproteobacteria bacterium]
MRLLTPIFLLVTTLLVMPNVNAYTVDGVEFSEVVPANAERPELKLNGASLRELYLLIETYVGALYLENPSTDAQSILDSEEHKRMVFHVMMKKVGARRIANALQEALVMNVTKEQHKKLGGEIEQMLSYFDGKMHRGEEAIFDYLPGKGTQITINNEVKGIIPGKDYFRAMLSIWIGENPVGRTFKDDILGLNRLDKTSQVAGQ